MAKDLRSFMADLKSKYPEELVYVKREVDPDLELCGVLRKLQEGNRYPATVFEKVKGTSMPVISNVMASRKLLAAAFGTTEAQLMYEYAKREEAQTAPLLVSSAEAPVKQVIHTGDDVDIYKLPNIVHCGGDGGTFISSGVIIAKDPDTGINNAGMYRMQIKAKNKTGIGPGAYSHFMHIYRKKEKAGEPLDIAIVIGHHPLFYMAGQYRGPLDMDELWVAGGLLGEPLRMVPAETVDLMVPADAEIIIEGRVLPYIREPEGPFGEYTWYLGPAMNSPVVEITAITHRKDAIYQDLFSSHPEHNLTGLLGREATMFKRVKQAVPTTTALTLPFSGTCRHTCYVSVKKEFDGVGKNVALAAMAADPFMKLIVVVDDDIDVFNEAEVMWAVTTRMNADRDIFIVPDAYVCELDPSAYDITGRTNRGAMNAKWAIDATKPVGLPFQERADVPETVWKNMDLDSYFKG
jgi:2,5-furandicarboxylate decarboxylase 1